MLLRIERIRLREIMQVKVVYNYALFKHYYCSLHS